MPSKNKLLGQFFCRSGLITEEQLKRALRQQKITGGKLSSIIVQLGYTTQKTIVYYLNRHLFVRNKNNKINVKKEKLIGEILVDHKVISQEQLNNALARINDEPEKLGYVLAELGIIDEASLLEALKKKLFNKNTTFSGTGKEEQDDEIDMNDKKELIASTVLITLIFVSFVLGGIYWLFEPALNQSGLQQQQSLSHIVPSPSSSPSNTDEIIEDTLDSMEGLNEEISKAEEEFIEDAQQVEDKTVTQGDNKVADEALANAITENNNVEIESKQKPETEITPNIPIANIFAIRYFSDGKTAKFVFDSDISLADRITREYRDNLLMYFRFDHVLLQKQNLQNGYSDKMIFDLVIKNDIDNEKLEMTYHTYKPTTSLYHILKPNKKIPYYRLAIIVRLK